MSDEELTEELTDKHFPERHEPDWVELESATSEEPFMKDSFYLLRETLHWMIFLSRFVPEVQLDRNRAIIRGLLVRQIKLIRLMIRELASQEAFQQLSIARFVLENIGTLLYLLQDTGDGSRFDQYVKNSLIAERELFVEIKRNVDKRDGTVLRIEERMRRSINNTAKAGGIEDVSALPGRAKIGFPSAEARVKLLGSAAYVAYRKGSAEAHGDWSDLYRNHLKYDGTSFVPNFDSIEVRPQLPLAITRLTTGIIARSIEAIIEHDDTADKSRHGLTELNDRAYRVDELHERFLQGLHE